MKYASIDIGTNSVLLLVAEKKDNGLSVIEEKQEIPRLGEDVDKEKNLSANSMNRVLVVLEAYKNWLQQNYPELVQSVKVTSTSAVRDASNRRAFLREINNRTGWSVRLLSGDEEAKTTYRGALSVLPDVKKMCNLVLDIGGGSTEIAKGRGWTLEKGVSFDMGSVRFTERYFSPEIPEKSEISRARVAARSFLNNLEPPAGDFRAIGVAGTVTSLAGIETGSETYDSKKLNGYKLKKLSIEKYISEFSELTGDEIEEKYPVFMKGRGDVILSGILILDEFLTWCGKKEIIVSTGGIRHGILISDDPAA